MSADVRLQVRAVQATLFCHFGNELGLLGSGEIQEVVFSGQAAFHIQTFQAFGSSSAAILRCQMRNQIPQRNAPRGADPGFIRSVHIHAIPISSARNQPGR